MSAMLSNIMDNTFFVECFDVAVLMSSMCLGWFTCSSFLRFMTRRHWQQHLRTKVAYADAYMSEICTGTVTQGPDSMEALQADAVDDAQKVRWLLESYGAFGASPGTWVSAASLELDAASETSVGADGESEGAESDLDSEPAQDSGFVVQAVADTKSNLGMLFEHYSLFQSEPGTWCPEHGEDSDETSEELMEDTANSGNDFLSGPLDGLVAPPRDDVARALFEQYSLFGAEPGTWSKDSDCSTNDSSESESAEATEDVTSDVNSDAEVDRDYLEDLVEE